MIIKGTPTIQKVASILTRSEVVECNSRIVEVLGESRNTSNTNKSFWVTYEHISKLLCLPTAAGDNGSIRRRGRVLSSKYILIKPLVLWIMCSVPVESTSELARARNDKICWPENVPEYFPSRGYIPQIWWTTRIKFTVLIKFIYLKRGNWVAYNSNLNFDNDIL